MTATKTAVMAMLRERKDPRGIANWKKRMASRPHLKSYGLGLTKLRKLAREIGRDHTLAQKLWKSDVYDARVLGLLIDEPKKMTREQAEIQVDELEGGLFAHVFATCDATLAKTKFAFPLSCEWMDSDDPMRRRCGYTLLYELSKKNPKGMDEAFLLDRIADISEAIDSETPDVRVAMAGALLGVGKRSKKLNKAAVRIAKKVGPIDIETGNETKCEPFDLLKHLTSDYVKNKLGL